jgi:hypothetical protein
MEQPVTLVKSSPHGAGAQRPPAGSGQFQVHSPLQVQRRVQLGVLRSQRPFS